MIEDEFYILGEMKAIFYENSSNFYKVLLIEVEENNFSFEKDEIVVTGNFGEITVDTEYRFTGTVVDHPKYGKQFQSVRYEREKPAGKNGIISFLSGDKFPGIGKKTAERIVEHLGEEAIDLIIKDSTSLKSIPGLNPKKRSMIHEVLIQTQGTEKIIIELANFGFTNNQAAAILHFYKSKTLEILKENPYQLIEDIEGIGFKRADRWAEEMNVPPDDKNRIKGAILASLQEISLSNGDTYVGSDELLDKALQVLESSRRFVIHDDLLIESLMELIQDIRIIEDSSRFSLPSLYFSEEGIASNMDRLLKKDSNIRYPGVDLEKELQKTQKELGIRYDEIQSNAIKEALTTSLFILTGGPGTGKTTVLNGIVRLYCELNDVPVDYREYEKEIYPIIMAAPTGRAAKRMNETTGLPSSTIHRLLGLTGQENQNEEVYTQELEGKLLIIDEASMVDTWLMNRLLKSVPVGMQIILVGDKDQLPSVGPGQVLFDLLNSKVIPHIELSQIYRQSDGSSIIPLAHDIKNGTIPSDFLKNQSDRSFFSCRAAQIEPLIRTVVEKAKAKGYTSKDIQVLAPMYKGAAGIDALNEMMQEILNPNLNKKRREVTYFDHVYRVGDKVLQLVNHAELNVFNGDMGEITGIHFAKETEDKVDEMTILFDKVEVTYKKNEWNKFSLAYCCSIHKAQGSEFSMVILPMVRQYGRMLKRNLLYTAITRSKDKLILCGEEEAFAFAAENTGDLRKTMLVEKLIRNSESSSIYSEKEPSVSLKQKKTISQRKPKNETEQTSTEKTRAGKTSRYTLTMEMIQESQLDPMIGMEDISPQHFVR